METGPFVIMFQDIDLIAERNNVADMIWGPSFDSNSYAKGRKG
jgi:peptide/nickel transport system substrate-binding protein